MPNGGTDNCMNCRHNRANQQPVSVKGVERRTRLPYCTVHDIPIRDRAWTYCANINFDSPDRAIPITTVGLFSSEGYGRIPWYGRIAPSRTGRAGSCLICGKDGAGEELLRLTSEPLGFDYLFCGNPHYRGWIKEKQAEDSDQFYQVGRTPLHEAALLGGPIEPLSPSGFIDARDHFGWTPLHIASFLGIRSAAQELLTLGANPTLTEGSGLTPIELAGSEGHDDVVRLLLEKSFPTSDDRERALLRAAAHGNLDLIVALLELGTDIETEDRRGRTPLQIAVWQGHYTASVYLLDQGANVLATDKHGNNALKTVNTWNARSQQELRKLIELWVEKGR